MKLHTSFVLIFITCFKKNKNDSIIQRKKKTRFKIFYHVLIAVNFTSIFERISLIMMRLFHK